MDITKFYGDELARAISDIRQDFKAHSQSQAKDLEEFYRIKIFLIVIKFISNCKQKTIN